jgi:hypothetical protein
MVVFSESTMSNYVGEHYKSVNKNRMHSAILQNMGIDTWMTFELMEAAINAIRTIDNFHVKINLESTLRDIGAAKVASKLALQNKDVDNFFCFHGIKFNGDTFETLKHGNRPDGTFKLNFKDSRDSDEKMVLFYEGDNHDKDEGKLSSTDGGCRNAHKFYQYFAQSQSYNPKFSGCTIIAAISRATAGFIPFLDAMFQAHMLAFAVIVDYNYQREKKKKKETFLGKHLELVDGVTYDFVIGINMGANSTSPFRSDFYDARVQFIQSLTKGNVDIIPEMKDTVEGILLHEHTIMSVGMVFIAVPRAELQYLKSVTKKPCFLYPMHLAEVVKFSTNELDVDLNSFGNVLNIRMISNQILKFRKHMMHIKRVLTTPRTNPKQDKPHDKDYCMLDNSSGFFLAALPVAYYTIQQLELVNDRLDYHYNKGAKSFKKVTDAYKDIAFENSKRKIKVSMMSKGKGVERVSLFHEICKSISECEEDIEEDLKSFLIQGCLWENTDDNSPVVFFKTMRIFSLQGAMDFAFDIQTGQNEVYSKMLLSYPIGTQIVIKQCMKKLTENGTPAYFLTEAEDNFAEISDIVDDKTEVNVTAMGRLIQSIGTNQKTSWTVKVEDNQPTNTQNDIVLADLLLREYKKQVTWKATQKPHTRVAPDCDEAIKNKIDELMKKQVMTSKFALKLENFNPETRYEVQYADHNYEFEPSIHENFVVNSERIYITMKEKVKQKKDTLVVFVQWGDKFAQFSYVHDETLIALLAERLSISTRNVGNRVWGLYEALLGIPPS